LFFVLGTCGKRFAEPKYKKQVYKGIGLRDFEQYQL